MSEKDDWIYEQLVTISAQIDELNDRVAQIVQEAPTPAQRLAAEVLHEIHLIRRRKRALPPAVRNGLHRIAEACEAVDDDEDDDPTLLINRLAEFADANLPPLPATRAMEFYYTDKDGIRTPTKQIWDNDGRVLYSGLVDEFTVCLRCGTALDSTFCCHCGRDTVGEW